MPRSGRRTDNDAVGAGRSTISVRLPKSLNKLLDEGQDVKFDKEMSLGMTFSPETDDTWLFRARPYDTTGYAETIQAVRRYTVADGITTPLLITSPKENSSGPARPNSSPPSPRASRPSSSSQPPKAPASTAKPLARTMTAQRIFDSLDDQVATPRTR